MQTLRSWVVFVGAALAAGCASASVQPLESLSSPNESVFSCAVTASDYAPHLDLLVLGYSDGTFEVRSPAPDHVLSRGKHRQAIVNVALSRDGRRLASLDDTGVLAVSSVENGALEVLSSSVPTSPDTLVGLAWDGSGRHLAVGTGQQLWLVDVETGAKRETKVKGGVAALTFSPDDRQLVTAGKELTFLSVPSLAEARKLDFGHQAVVEGKVSDVRFSPDGGELGILMMSGIAFVDLASGSIERARFNALHPVGLRFAGDGRVAVFGRRSVYIGPPTPATIEQEARATQGELTDVEFRKDGSLMFLGDAQDVELAALMH